MTSPKINVGATFDNSAVKVGLDEVKNKAAEVNKVLNSGSVGLDVKDAKAKLDGLEKSATALAETLSKAAEAGAAIDDASITAVAEALSEAADNAKSLDEVLDAIGQSSGMGASVKHAKETAEHIVRAAKAQRELHREGVKLTREQAQAAKEAYDKLRGSGARGTARFRDMGFDEYVGGGWQNESVNSAEARRKRRDVLKRIGIDLPESEGSGGGGSGGRGTGGRSTAARIAGRFGGAAAGAATGAISGGGFGMGAMAGAAVGMIPGAGMVLGPLAGALGGIMDKALERALAEATDLSDLRRSMGATKVDFEDLRGEIRLAATGLGITYNEAAKLARVFSHTANMAGQGVGRETGNAAGFARGFGMDPQVAVQFFATMRHYGVTQSERDGKRLALSIAEAVGKGGISPKADEALGAIQNYVQAASRQSLTESNAEAYASFMASLTGLPHYGMKGDPAAAASAMGKADMALRSGGGFGEASRNFSLGLYQRMLPGFSSFDMDYLNEQGAFGTVERAFAEDSPAYALARSRGDKGKMGQYSKWAGIGGDRSILSMQMAGLDQTYGSSTDGFRKAIQSHLGVSASEASALYQAYKRDNGLGSLQKQLSGAGVDISKLNTRQIASLAEVAGASRGGITGQANKLLGLTGADALSGGESDELRKALANGDPEELRKVTLKLTALHDTTKDEGDDLRRIQSDMQNNLQEMATKLIPLTVGINEKMGELVKALAPESKYAKDAARDADTAKFLDAELAKLKRSIEAPPLTAAQKAARADMVNGSATGMGKGLGGPISFDKLQPKGGDGGEKAAMIRRYNELRRQREALSDSVGPSQFGAMSAEGKMRPPDPDEGGSRRLGRRRGVLSAEQKKWRDRIAAEADRQGLTREEKAAALALAEHESSFNPNARGAVIRNPNSSHYGDRAHGLFQFMGKSARGWDRHDPAQNIKHGIANFKRNARKFGVGGAITAHHSGEGNVNPDGSIKVNRSDGNQTTQEYRNEILREAAKYRSVAFDEHDGRIPGGVRSPSPQLAQNVTIDGTFTLVDSTGRPVANQVQTRTRVGAPMPAGMRA